MYFYDCFDYYTRNSIKKLVDELEKLIESYNKINTKRNFRFNKNTGGYSIVMRSIMQE